MCWAVKQEPCPFNPGKELRTHCAGCWVGSRTHLDRYVEEIIPCLYRNSKSEPLGRTEACVYCINLSVYVQLHYVPRSSQIVHILKSRHSFNFTYRPEKSVKGNFLTDTIFTAILKRLRWSRGSVLAFGTRPKPSDFSGRKIPQHAFLRKGSKVVCPMSHICGM